MIGAALSRAGRRADLLALIAGALTPLAFAPFDFFPLALLAPAALFVLWHGTGGGRAAWLGLLFGIGMFGVGVSWVYVSLHTYGNMPAPLAALAVVLFVGALAAFPAAVGWLQAYFRVLAPGLRVAVVTPALWALFEWIRGWFLTGFPWLALGYSQIDTPLAGFAPWVGVYGVGAAAAASAGLLAAAWIDRRRAWRLYLPVVAALWIAGWLAASVTWVQPFGQPLRVALIQADTPLGIKWRPEYRQAIINKYVALSEQAVRADLIVWPEAAVPDYFDRVEGTLVPRLQEIARDRGADFLIGAVERGAGRSTYYNTVYAVGHNDGRYRKRHLVPFGEFLPLPGLLGGLLHYLHIPMSNFSSGGAHQPPLHAAGHAIGVSVCYEDAFGEEIAATAPAVTLLVNVSEDSWFGRSLAPHQRLQMARMRALEAGRPMLRAANTGPSAIIDYRGVVLRRSPEFMTFVLSGTVQPTTGVTPYARYLNTPIVVLLCLIVVAALGLRMRRLS